MKLGSLCPFHMMITIIPWMPLSRSLSISLSLYIYIYIYIYIFLQKIMWLDNENFHQWNDSFLAITNIGYVFLLTLTTCKNATLKVIFVSNLLFCWCEKKRIVLFENSTKWYLGKKFEKKEKMKNTHYLKIITQHVCLVKEKKEKNTDRIT